MTALSQARHSSSCLCTQLQEHCALWARASQDLSTVTTACKGELCNSSGSTARLSEQRDPPVARYVLRSHEGQGDLTSCPQAISSMTHPGKLCRIRADLIQEMCGGAELPSFRTGNRTGNKRVFEYTCTSRCCKAILMWPSSGLSAALPVDPSSDFCCLPTDLGT